MYVLGMLQAFVDVIAGRVDRFVVAAIESGDDGVVDFAEGGGVRGVRQMLGGGTGRKRSRGLTGLWNGVLLWPC